jgi:hypothetical protein
MGLVEQVANEGKRNKRDRKGISREEERKQTNKRQKSSQAISSHRLSFI